MYIMTSLHLHSTYFLNCKPCVQIHGVAAKLLYMAALACHSTDTHKSLEQQQTPMHCSTKGNSRPTICKASKYVKAQIR